MKCEGCDKEFNANKRRPHFLIQCGHSLCQKCIKRKFSDSTLICPRCDTKNYATTVDEFPINMTVLEADRSNSIISKYQSNVLRSGDSECISIENICPRHGRKFEGNRI